ncbi:hypothetical protein GCM10011515_00060 [Tsuneonella deserti]|uniref:DUF2958 domain-containing protein n=1 Tax=Tsuneonella deserti TaxID=2035528 RepID=A0ABQ1RXF6_9SPHN|nr:DUF2958 domain-containing protein [Tsuneonella deserti]GGD84300.1 hypothetical protein GCM10011515_00060 [Tsuneonella deserti]
MILLPPPLAARLRANAAASAAANTAGRGFDPPPVLKLFNPLGPATWLASELAEDRDTLFGLADLGFGCPELGTFGLSEIAALRLPFGMRIERDLLFISAQPLSRWASAARECGSIAAAELLLRHAVRHGRAAPDLPLPSNDEGGG